MKSWLSTWPRSPKLESHEESNYLVWVLNRPSFAGNLPQWKFKRTSCRQAGCKPQRLIGDSVRHFTSLPQLWALSGLADWVHKQRTTHLMIISLLQASLGETMANLSSHRIFSQTDRGLKFPLRARGCINLKQGGVERASIQVWFIIIGII